MKSRKVPRSSTVRESSLLCRTTELPAAMGNGSLTKRLEESSACVAYSTSLPGGGGSQAAVAPIPSARASALAGRVFADMRFSFGGCAVRRVLLQPAPPPDCAGTGATGVRLEHEPHLLGHLLHAGDYLGIVGGEGDGDALGHLRHLHLGAGPHHQRAPRGRGGRGGRAVAAEMARA